MKAPEPSDAVVGAMPPVGPDVEQQRGRDGMQPEGQVKPVQKTEPGAVRPLGHHAP